MNNIKRAVERFGDWCLHRLEVWLMGAALVLLAILICVQAGIHKGRMLERAELKARSRVVELSDTNYLYSRCGSGC